MAKARGRKRAHAPASGSVRTGQAARRRAAEARGAELPRITVKGIIAVIVVAALVLSLLFYGIGREASHYTAIQPGQATCSVSLGQSSINFGTLSPPAYVPTSIPLVDTNFGTAAANIIMYGSNWESPTHNFSVSTIVWNPSPSSTLAIGNALNPAPYQDTKIRIQPDSSATIYFGLELPSDVPPGSYSQTIYVENYC